MCTQPSKSFTVKEEVDLQNRGLFVSTTTSEASLLCFLYLAIFRRGRGKKIGEKEDFPFRLSRGRSQRISASGAF